MSSRPHRCSIQGCGKVRKSPRSFREIIFEWFTYFKSMIIKWVKEFKLKSHLLRHSVLVHDWPLPPGSPRPSSKTRTAFYLGNNNNLTLYLPNTPLAFDHFIQWNFFFQNLAVAPSTRLARRFCAHLLRPRRAARFPFVPIGAAAIRQDCEHSKIAKPLFSYRIWMTFFLFQSKCEWHVRHRQKYKPWCCVPRSRWHRFVLQSASALPTWPSVWLVVKFNRQRPLGSFFPIARCPNPN